MYLNFDLSRPDGYKDGLILGPPESVSEFESADLSDTDWTQLGEYTRREGKHRLFVVRSSFAVEIAVCLTGQSPGDVTSLKLRPLEAGKEAYTGMLEAASGSIHARLL